LKPLADAGSAVIAIVFGAVERQQSRFSFRNWNVRTWRKMLVAHERQRTTDYGC
jgi:hypothetical protein